MEQNSSEQKPDYNQLEKLLIPGAIVLSGIIVAVAVFYTGGIFRVADKGAPEKAAVGEAAVETGNIEDDDPAIGNPEAPVVLVEFSDFQCPFCRRFWRESFPQILDKYIKTGKVRFVYRDFPLSNIHSAADPAAQAGECASEQNKFWELHDKIFQEQDKLGEGTIQFSASDIKRWAREIGIEGASFDACLESGKYQSEVSKDYHDGAALGVTGTPNVFVNGKLLIRGAISWPQVEDILERELAGR